MSAPLYWELIADKIAAAGWSYGCTSYWSGDQLMKVIDAHKDGVRFIVHADDILTGFLEIEASISTSAGAKN